MLITFGMVTLAFVFFRAENLSHALDYFSNMVNGSLLSLPEIFPKQLLALILFMLLIEWIGRNYQHALEQFGLKWPKWLRLGFYYLMVAAIFFLSGNKQDFIYFQF